MSPPELYYNSINIMLSLFRTVGQSRDATFNLLHASCCEHHRCEHNECDVA